MARLQPVIYYLLLLVHLSCSTFILCNYYADTSCSGPLIGATAIGVKYIALFTDAPLETCAQRGTGCEPNPCVYQYCQYATQLTRALTAEDSVSLTLRNKNCDTSQPSEVFRVDVGYCNILRCNPSPCGAPQACDSGGGSSIIDEISGACPQAQALPYVDVIPPATTSVTVPNITVPTTSGQGSAACLGRWKELDFDESGIIIDLPSINRKSFKVKCLPGINLLDVCIPISFEVDLEIKAAEKITGDLICQNCANYAGENSSYSATTPFISVVDIKLGISLKDPCVLTGPLIELCELTEKAIEITKKLKEIWEKLKEVKEWIVFFDSLFNGPTRVCNGSPAVPVDKRQAQTTDSNTTVVSAATGTNISDPVWSNTNCSVVVNPPRCPPGVYLGQGEYACCYIFSAADEQVQISTTQNFSLSAFRQTVSNVTAYDTSNILVVASTNTSITMVVPDDPALVSAILHLDPSILSRLNITGVAINNTVISFDSTATPATNNTVISFGSTTAPATNNTVISFNSTAPGYGNHTSVAYKAAPLLSFSWLLVVSLAGVSITLL